MSPVKSQSRASATRQRAGAEKKGNLQKNVRQNGSKASRPPSKVHKGKRENTENSPTLEDGKTDVVKSNRRNKENLNKKGDTEQNGPQIPVGRTLGNGLTSNGRSQLQHDKDSKITGDANKTTRLKPSPKTPETKRGGIKSGNKRNDRMSESEEEEEDESESGADSSVEVTGQGTSSDEKEEEQRSNKEPAETQGSEESSEESEASDIQRDTEQTANEESDKELSEEAKSRSDSEIESVASSEEGEETEKESEVSEAATSDGGEDPEITQEAKSEKPRVDKACRRPRQTPRPSRPSQGSKSKMFKKTKADKQAEKAEKQRAKAEKQRLEKEAKQKAKEEKKNKKKAVKEGKPSSPTEETQPPKGLSLNKVETAKGKTKLANKAKNIQEKDALLEAASADPEAEEEEEDDEPTVTKAIKGQNKMMLLKAKGKNLKAILEPEEKQDTGSVVKGQPKSFLLGKVKMVSLKQKANKMIVKSEEETECEALDGGSNKPKECLIARRKGMTTLRRVSGWIQKNVPRGLNLRKKLSAWSKAIGVSRWLSLRAIKQKQGARKSKGNIFKHRMAMTVASKSNLGNKKNRSSSEDKEKANVHGKSGEGGEEAVLAGEKEVEAKYAVVLPRMNKLGKAKAVELPQAAPGPSTPLSTTGSPGDVITLEPKPPKPGARLVLPVKPDLSLLKSIKKPLPGGLASGGDVAERSLASSGPQEGSSNTVDRNRRAALENQDGVSVLQAARRKLDPSQINLTKMSLSGGTMGGGAPRANRPEPERETAAGLPMSTTQLFANGEASSAMTGVRSLYEEEADREVAQLMGEGGIYKIPQPEVHWAGNPRMSGDPQDWLRAENLLPHQTVEKLTKWTVYDDEGQARIVPAHNGRGPWESEDPTQEMLESRLVSTQGSIHVDATPHLQTCFIETMFPHHREL